jgi:NADH:ubiquinone oxidoreductase subunit 6 (subunit J)
LLGRLAIKEINFKTVMSTNNINVSMKKSNEQKEFVFAVSAIFLSVIFLITLFYVKYSNEKNTIDSKEKQQEPISYVTPKQ